MIGFDIPLDSVCRHRLRLESDAAGFAVVFNCPETDRRSPLLEALRRHLILRADGREYQFPPDRNRLEISPPPSMLEVLLGRGASFTLARVSLAGSPRTIGQTYSLTPFETRYLADNGHPFPVPSAAPAADRAGETDLHCHFAGCVAPETLLQIGMECQIEYPASVLAEAGIRLTGREAMPLAELSPELRQRLANRLAIPLDRQITFLDLERIYRLRGPITKNLRAFVPLLRQIARDYQAMGVRYAELSLGTVIEAERLRAIHRELPAIEAETGVQLRFLAAMSRHDDLEWDLDYIDRLRELAGSPYLVGVDFMGHETNSTSAFLRPIQEVARWADAARPGWVVRVHAGENPAYPENVRIAAEAVAGCQVQLRVGHGLYGVDLETQLRLREMGAVVEFNLNSNFALNNIQSPTDAPIAEYLERGLPVVLGTDGYGIYGTTPALELRAARLAGMPAGAMAAIRATEAEYVRRRREWDAPVTVEPEWFVVPEDRMPRHFTPEVVTRRRSHTQAQDQALLARLRELEVQNLEGPAVDLLLRDRQPLCVAGAWANSWERLSAESRVQVRRELAALLRELRPEETVLVTGGTRHGVEGVVQELAREGGFPVLGVLVWETPPAALEPDTITHACIVGQKLYDKAAGLYRLMQEHNALCLFIGGGPIVNDEIQVAANLRVRYLLMDGPEGASTQHARQQPDRAFRTAEEVLRVLRVPQPWASTPAPYWHLGMNPTVDLVLTRNHPHTGEREVLLVRRDEDAPCEPGRWALPGGFPRTDAPRGTPWLPGPETLRQACLRELREEAGLDLAHLEPELLEVGEYQGEGRDPRDTPEAWSRTTVFALHLPEPLAHLPIAGGDDAGDARWIAVDQLPSRLAFDHARLLADGLAALERRGK